MTVVYEPRRIRATGPAASNDGIRLAERASIRGFVQSVADDGHLSGRVLDYGCGRQPYRDVVEAAGGTYVGYDRASFPANVSVDDVGPAAPLEQEWDAILCNQMLQYVPDPRQLLRLFRAAVAPAGVLVLTFATSWDEVEPADLWRFTAAGMRYLLATAGFEVERLDRRAEVELGGFRLPLGYGAVARA